jgi:hypothetical protein
MDHDLSFDAREGGEAEYVLGTMCVIECEHVVLVFMLVDELSVGIAEGEAVDVDGVLSEEVDPGVAESCGTGDSIEIPADTDVDTLEGGPGVLISVRTGGSGTSDFPGTI